MRKTIYDQSQLRGRLRATKYVCRLLPLIQMSGARLIVEKGKLAFPLCRIALYFADEPPDNLRFHSRPFTEGLADEQRGVYLPEPKEDFSHLTDQVPSMTVMNLAFQQGHITAYEYACVQIGRGGPVAKVEKILNEWYVDRETGTGTTLPYDDEGLLQPDLIEYLAARHEGRDPDPSRNGRNSDDRPLRHSDLPH